MITCRQCGRPQAKALCDRCKSSRYDAEHRLQRQLWLPIVAMGETRCSRADEDPACPGVIGPADEWDLDHRPDGSRPAHADCNRRAGARSIP